MVGIQVVGHGPLVLTGVHPEDVEALFPSFMEMWRDEERRQIVQLLVSFFVDSSQAFAVETGIVVAQAGLELLAREILVEDQALVARKSFKDAAAVDKIRLLSLWVGIPRGFLARVPSRNREAKKVDLFDTWEMATRVRNGIAHPFPIAKAF